MLVAGVTPFDSFVVVSGSFSIVATVPLLYLAVRSLRDGRSLRRLQLEVAQLMVEVHHLQGEIHRDQREAVTKIEDAHRRLDRVAEQTRRRRRLPRLRVSVER